MIVYQCTIFAQYHTYLYLYSITETVHRHTLSLPTLRFSDVFRGQGKGVPTNCFSVFDHSVGLLLKGLISLIYLLNSLNFFLSDKQNPRKIQTFFLFTQCVLCYNAFFHTYLTLMIIRCFCFSVNFDVVSQSTVEGILKFI